MQDFVDLYEAVQRKADWVGDLCLGGGPESWFDAVLCDFEEKYDAVKNELRTRRNHTLS